MTIQKTTEIGNGDAIIVTYNKEYDEWYIHHRWGFAVTTLTPQEAKALATLFNQIKSHDTES